MVFLVVGQYRAARWPDQLVPGLRPPATTPEVMATAASIARKQAQHLGRPPRPLAKWIYRAVALAIGPAMWLAWSVSDRSPPGSIGSRVLLASFAATGFTGLILALVEAHSASRAAFAYHRPPRGAPTLRWLVLIPTPVGVWLAIEAFRQRLISDFVFSSGTAGDIMASEAFPTFAGTLLWAGAVYALGKLIGPLLTIDELLNRYKGAQITLLRSFKDDDAGVDFEGPVKPDARYQQVRLEPQITQTLELRAGGGD
jgi:hypothetical protein